MARRAAAGYVPAELSSFVGRREELSEVRRLLGESRLVTLTGTAGVGKSRLARRVAALLAPAFRHGVWVVGLEDVGEDSVVPDSIASVLGVPEHSGRDPANALGDFVADREMLLVLDDCGRVARPLTVLLDALLRRAPRLRVLATSPEVLGVMGEITYRVEPLPLPSEDDLATAELNPAVALFIERAAAAVPGLALGPDDLPTVVDICRRLDGIPLALELAAPQLRVMSPPELAARLDDRFRLLVARRSPATTRHRTLRGAVEWSYEVCDESERLLWQRLSVFAGDFDLVDAEEVCADELLGRMDLVEAMRGLVDKSILSVRVHESGMQFRLLDTLRRYGLDRLAEGTADGPVKELELRVRHLRWYAELCGRFEADWFGPRQREWLVRLGMKLPDIRAALGFASEHPDHVSTGLRTAAALCWFWATTATLREGRGWLVRLLDVGREPTRERSRALSALAVLLATIGSGEGGAEIAREALEIARREDPERLPRVLQNVGMMLVPHGHPDGIRALEEALTLCRERDLGGEDLAFATYTLGYGRGLTGEPDAAQALFAESIEVCREAGDVWWQGVVRIISAFVAWAHGDGEHARSYALEGLRASRLVPDVTACAVGLNIMGILLVDSDDRIAAGLLGTADRYWADAGGSWLQTPAWIDHVERAKGRCRANLGATAYDAAHCAGQEQSIEDAVAVAIGEPTESVAPDAAPPEQFALTRREHEVAALVAEGMSSREIASRLVISPRTAETHVQNILVKTGFGTRSQLARWYTARTRA